MKHRTPRRKCAMKISRKVTFRADSRGLLTDLFLEPRQRSCFLLSSMRHGSFVRKRGIAHERATFFTYKLLLFLLPREMVDPLDYVRSAVVKLSEIRNKRAGGVTIRNKGPKMNYCGNVKKNSQSFEQK